MKVTNSKAQIIKSALSEWANNGVLSFSESQRLQATIEIEPFDWLRLVKYSVWAALVCVVIAIGAVLSDKVLLALLRKWFNAPDLIKCLGFAGVAAVLYAHGVRRKSENPLLIYTNEAIFFLGALATAGAIFHFGKTIDMDMKHFSLLLLLGSVAYGVLGICFESTLIWIVALLSFGSWLGAETGYLSGWGSYYLGMNYPIRFIFLGCVLSMLSFLMLRSKKLTEFYKPTYVIGLLYLFNALWLTSIFGNYGSINGWYRVQQVELFHWSLMFTACSLGAIYHGLRFDNKISRNFGIVFLFINLYTRFFEHFWNPMHKAVFFLLLGVSFWILGSKAEKILMFIDDTMKRDKR